MPETSESLSVGLIVELEVIDMSIAVDYFDFDIEKEKGRSISEPAFYVWSG